MSAATGIPSLTHTAILGASVRFNQHVLTKQLWLLSSWLLGDRFVGTNFQSKSLLGKIHSMIFELSLVVIASFLAAVVFTPIVRKLAFRFDIVDRPDPLRKLHGRTVARAGGVAVLFAVLLACSGALLRLKTNLLNSKFSIFMARS